MAVLREALPERDEAPESRANYDAFRSADGQGSFLTCRRALGSNGHFIADDPPLWTADLDAYLRSIGGS